MNKQSLDHLTMRDLKTLAQYSGDLQVLTLSLIKYREEFTYRPMLEGVTTAEKMHYASKHSAIALAALSDLIQKLPSNGGTI